MRAQRLLNTAAATLAAGVVTDGTTEHYRAGFHNPAMFVAPIVSAAVLAAAAKAAVQSRDGGTIHSAVLGVSVVTGLAGFGFHVTNTSRRVGGWRSSSNVFYGAPATAPLAMTMAGVLGLVASQLDRRPASSDPLPAALHAGRGRIVAGLAVLGLCGTAAEAGALHFRGAFQNPFMYTPVVVPPVTAAALATAARTPSPAARGVARSLLHLTTWLGIAGMCFHAWGVHRRMGGWRNWCQNLLAGPPIPAPPAFSGLALAGLAALELLNEG